MHRVCVYVDGFNLYHGMKEETNGRSLLWLDLWSLAERLLKKDSDQELVAVKHFSARISVPEESRVRQNTYLEALQARGVSLHFGKMQADGARCSCGLTKPKEKETDVRIAVEILCDAYHDLFDTAVLVSGDGDLRPPLAAVRRLFPAKRTVVAFPPNRISKSLQQVTNGKIFLNSPILRQCQLPHVVVRGDGHQLHRPTKWR